MRLVGDVDTRGATEETRLVLATGPEQETTTPTSTDDSKAQMAILRTFAREHERQYYSNSTSRKGDIRRQRPALWSGAVTESAGLAFLDGGRWLGLRAAGGLHLLLFKPVGLLKAHEPGG